MGSGSQRDTYHPHPYLSDHSRKRRETIGRLRRPPFHTFRGEERLDLLLSKSKGPDFSTKVEVTYSCSILVHCRDLSFVRFFPEIDETSLDPFEV